MRNTDTISQLKMGKKYNHPGLSPVGRSYKSPPGGLGRSYPPSIAILLGQIGKALQGLSEFSHNAHIPPSLPDCRTIFLRR